MPNPPIIAGPSLPLALAPAMADVLRRAAQDAVLPRFRRLATCDVEEKSPGELVTIADREAERIIAAGLASICPNARFVGEEACARAPELLRGLDRGDVWIVDPIDGTANYAAGRAPFAMMAALLRNGEAIASAILDPLSGSVTLAERGAGAWQDGVRLGPIGEGGDLATISGIVSGFQRPAAMEPQIERLATRLAQVVPTRRCAGAEYPLIASGQHGFALYWRTLVWDHAPGVLIIEEAGGKAARLHGSRFRAADGGAVGATVGGGAILITHHPETWDQLAALLSQ